LALISSCSTDLYAPQVEVTVINNNPPSAGSEASTPKWHSKIHELEQDAEAIGPRICRRLSNLSARAQEVVSVSRRSSFTKGKQKEASEEGERRQAAADDSAIADGDDDDEGWASEGSLNEPAPCPRTLTAESRKTARSSLSRNLKGVHHPHTTHMMHRPRRRGSIRRNSNAAAEIVEELRGRSATIGDPGVTLANPHSAFRPGTGSSSITMGSRTSRPGTADSSVRNHRLESIRAQHASGPPTRESSPSRSVRFVDEERRPGAKGVVADWSGKTLVDSLVAEEGL
jgi:hypothetical protein